MKSRLLSLAAAGALLAGCSDPVTPVTASAPSADATSLATGRRLVLFRAADGVPAELAADVAALGGTVEYTLAAIGGASVSGLSDAAATALAGRSYVASVVADYDVSVVRPLETPESAEASVAESGAESAEASPARPDLAAAYPRQWNLRAIGAHKAWAANRRGSPQVTVAIVDGGIDYLHRELAGHVDLARSVSFVPSDDAIIAQLFPTRHPVSDLYTHGTIVATIVSSNAVSVAGVTSGLTLMGVKVIGVDGFAPVSNVLRGIVWAADHGADVANVSLGDHYGRLAMGGPAIAAINRTMNYAHRKGMTVVVAAGNDAIDADHNGNEYIESCNAPNVICVAATGPTNGALTGPWVSVDAPADYSNYGRSMIDVAAPGGGPVPNTWIYGACSSSSVVLPCGPTSVIRTNGTSLAAPHVSALAALLVESLGRNPGAIRDALIASSDDLGAAGTDPHYGKGRINVARALGIE